MNLRVSYYDRDTDVNTDIGQKYILPIVITSVCDKNTKQNKKFISLNISLQIWITHKHPLYAQHLVEGHVLSKGPGITSLSALSTFMLLYRIMEEVFKPVVCLNPLWSGHKCVVWSLAWQSSFVILRVELLPKVRVVLQLLRAMKSFTIYNFITWLKAQACKWTLSGDFCKTFPIKAKQFLVISN